MVTIQKVIHNIYIRWKENDYPNKELELSAVFMRLLLDSINEVSGMRNISFNGESINVKIYGINVYFNKSNDRNSPEIEMELFRLLGEIFFRGPVYNTPEVVEIIRQVLYHGDPEYYEKGGITGCINFPKGETHRKAKMSFDKYFLKK